jgi:hypothetical protein
MFFGKFAATINSKMIREVDDVQTQESMPHADRGRVEESSGA